VNTVLLALDAMGTRFELVLHGRDPVALRAAGEQALREIERAERLLSCYRADSEITAVNFAAARAPVRVSADVMGVLAGCRAAWEASAGAFDVTVGPLVRAWGFAGSNGGWPDADLLAAARAATGMQHVELDREAGTVRFLRGGMALDLGAAGKGFAVDLAIAALLEAGVTTALLHGGTSSVHAIGAPPGEDAWPIAVGALRVNLAGPRGSHETAGPDGPVESDGPGRALSVSGVDGKAFVHEGRVYGHVIDARTGVPTRAARRAWVTGPSSFLCDTLSTALLVRGPVWIEEMQARWPGYRGGVEAWPDAHPAAGPGVATPRP
jgi:thiamine biosynthesis lipoprotein